MIHLPTENLVRMYILLIKTVVYSYNIFVIKVSYAYRLDMLDIMVSQAAT